MGMGVVLNYVWQGFSVPVFHSVSSKQRLEMFVLVVSK